MSARENTGFDLDALTRTRLHLAGQIAAGLVSNPQQIALRSWEAETARAALSVADKIIRLAISGGV